MLGVVLGDPHQEELNQVGVAGPHHLREGRARLHPALGQPQRELAFDDEGRVASARHGDMQNRLPGLACPADAVSGLPHDDRLAWGVPEARVFSAVGAGRLPDERAFTSTAATAASPAPAARGRAQCHQGVLVVRRRRGRAPPSASCP
jgi:hypothetical protein